MSLQLNLPKRPVDRFEVTYFTIQHERVQEIRLVYHRNSKWSDVCEAKGGADFADEWQVFVNDYFTGRMEHWLTPSTQKHEQDYATRTEAVNALKLEFERLARQADESARQYREKARQVEL